MFCPALSQRHLQVAVFQRIQQILLTYYNFNKINVPQNLNQQTEIEGTERKKLPIF